MFIQVVSHKSRIQLCWKANISQISQLNFYLLTSRCYLPKEYGWFSAGSMLPAMAFVHQSCGIITFHFSVWLPFVVPSPERFAVIFCTLLGTEVQTICWTWLSITKLINTTGTLAEFATILWPKKKKRKKKSFAALTFYVIGTCYMHINRENERMCYLRRSVFLIQTINFRSC